MKTQICLLTISILILTSCASLKSSKDDVIFLDKQMDDWHASAAAGDTDGYFNLMDTTFIYLGTDLSERWDKKTFLSFCKPYFDKGSGWDFKATSRTWYFNGKTAWFEENLTTWMGPIRASGVFLEQKEGWKIAHYNLTLTVANDKMKSFLKLNPVKN